VRSVNPPNQLHQVPGEQMRKDLSSGFLTCPTLALFTQEESKIATTWRFRRYTVYHVGV